MELVYANGEVERLCTSYRAAKKLFGGSEILARKLHSRINAIEQAETLKDIIAMPSFRFHKLEKRGRAGYDGRFAIDVKTVRDPWRLILEPLSEDKQVFVPCEIDKIACVVRIVRIMEVSKHYE